jgi:hypothetical protein
MDDNAHQRKMEFMISTSMIDNHTAFGIHIRAGNNEKGSFTKKGRTIRSGPKQFVSALVTLIRGYFSIEGLPRPPMIYLSIDDPPQYRIVLMDEMQEQGLSSWPVAVLDQEFAKSGVGPRARNEKIRKPLVAIAQS